jgi:hypothetical protein
MTADHRRGESGVASGATPERPEHPVDVGMLRRCLRALSRNVGDADLVALAEMVELRDELEGNITDAIVRLRHDPVAPVSWSQVGRALGLKRRRAWQKYGKVGGSRRPGGQAGHLR